MARCPRCGRGFGCGAAGPASCACARIVLEPALLRRLAQRWRDCLCADCLHALAAGAPLEPPRGGPAAPA